MTFILVIVKIQAVPFNVGNDFSGTVESIHGSWTLNILSQSLNFFEVFKVLRNGFGIFLPRIELIFF